MKDFLLASMSCILSNDQSSRCTDNLIALAAADHQGISDCTAASFEFFESGKQPDEKMLENPGFWALQGQQPPDGSPP